MILLCDIDGVVADLMPAWLARYNMQWCDHLAPSDITNWDMTRFVKPECGKSIYSYLEMPTLYDTVMPIAGALDAIVSLRERHRIVFVTAANANFAGRKLQWLVQHGFLDYDVAGVCGATASRNYVEALDKSLIRGDLLIDDNPRNLLAFHGASILFSAPANAGDSRFARATDWSDALCQLGKRM